MEISATWGIFITSLICFTTIYSLGSLAGLISERSGIVNIALDGKMIIGALVFVSLMNVPSFKDGLGTFAPYMGIIIAGFCTALFSTLLSLATINFMADQVIAGTALNLIAPAFSLLFMKAIFNTQNLTFENTSAGWASTINTVAIVMIIVVIVIVVIAWFIINKTYIGLRMISSGENPYALETSGISVMKTRWIALTIAGFLTGMGGALFPIALGASTFNGTVNGSGFISLAILIVGQWKIVGIFITSLSFSTLTALASSWVNLGTSLPFEIINILPFILPIIVLMIIKNSNSPLASGKPYRKDIR